MTIANQLLEGKVVQLSKPLLVCQRAPGRLNGVGVIRKKILFSVRPTPILRPAAEAKPAEEVKS